MGFRFRVSVGYTGRASEVELSLKGQQIKVP